MERTNRNLGFLLIVLWAFCLFVHHAHAFSIRINNGQVEIDQGDDGTSSAKITGCIEGNGSLAKETRVLPLIDKVNISGAFELNVGFGTTQSLEILCDANLLSRISTRVTDDYLFIATSASICPRSGLTINLILTKLEELVCRGANDIAVDAIVNDRFILNSDGANDIRISGETDIFNVQLSGAGDLNAIKFMAQSVTIDSQGAGDASLYASKHLKVVLNGVGDVFYYGSPDEVVSSIRSVGDLVECE